MSRPSYTRTAAPATTAVTLDEAKDHLRVDHNDEDSLILALIDAATGYAQEYQWSQLITSTWEMRLDRFPSQIELHPNPVVSVSSVQYVNTSGTTVALTVTTDYIVDVLRRPALVYPAFNVSWPSTRGFHNDVIVTFVAGYGSASAVPRNIKQAMLLLIGHWYRHRESTGCAEGEIEFATKALLELNSFRVFT